MTRIFYWMTLIWGLSFYFSHLLDNGLRYGNNYFIRLKSILPYVLLFRINFLEKRSFSKLLQRKCASWIKRKIFSEMNKNLGETSPSIYPVG